MQEFMSLIAEAEGRNLPRARRGVLGGGGTRCVLPLQVACTAAQTRMFANLGDTRGSHGSSRPITPRGVEVRQTIWCGDPLPRRNGDVVGVACRTAGRRPRSRRTVGVGDVRSRTSTGVRGEPSERRRLAPPPGWLRHPARRLVGRNRHRRDPWAKEAHLSRTFPAIDPK